jgi:hypothetical protein
MIHAAIFPAPKGETLEKVALVGVLNGHGFTGC